MQEITLKVTPEQLNMIQNALNALIMYSQQQAAVLVAGLQSQANAQLQPVATVEAPKV